MAVSQKDISQIDKQVDEFLAKSSASKGFNICAIWLVVKPILTVVKTILFFKPKWQTVIDQFIAVVDGFCAAPVPPVVAQA